MKKKIVILVTSIILTSININAQFFTYTTLPASCSSCCDGSFSVEITYCPNTAFDATSNTLIVRQTVVCCPNIYIFRNVCPGDYPFYTFATEICVSVSQTITMPFSTGIFEEENTDSLKLFPNPVSDKLHICIEKGIIKENTQIKIIDILGNLSNFSIEKQNLVNVSQLPNGIYFLQVWEEEQLVSTKKFLKE